MLEKKYKMVIVVKYGDFSSISYGSSVRAAGIFTYDGLCKLANKYIEENRPAVSRFKCKTKIWDEFISAFIYSIVLFACFSDIYSVDMDSWCS